MKILKGQELNDFIEAILLSSEDPVTINEIKELTKGSATNLDINNALEQIKLNWEGKSVELTQVASGWRFQVTQKMQRFINDLRPPKVPRYSRAVMETLAIIAYKQPVTRGDIEDIRAVSISSNIIRLLHSRGWIETIGQRETPGRPELLATTKKFLDDLNLKSLNELPSVGEIGSLILSDNQKKELDSVNVPKNSS